AHAVRDHSAARSEEGAHLPARGPGRGGRYVDADHRVERLAQRLLLVDPERLRDAGGARPRPLPPPPRARPRARGRGARRLRAAALRGTQEPRGTGELPRARHARDALPALRGGAPKEPMTAAP